MAGKAKSQQSLDTWTNQQWRTPSGKKSSKTGEVYLPEGKIKQLKASKKGRAKLSKANQAKRKATKQGKQYSSHGLHKGINRNG